jgi:CheY-like chemotaxis protein
MSGRSAHLEDTEAIRMVIQRLCKAGQTIHLQFNVHGQDFPIYRESEDRMILGLPALTMNQWGLKPGAKMALTLNDRGRRYEAIVELGGSGHLDGVECCHVFHPRMLRCLDDARLADFVPDQPLRCTYAARHLDIRDGRIRAVGLEGVEMLIDRISNPFKEDAVRVGTETMLELFLDKGTRVLAPARFSHFGEGYAGLPFREDGDQSYRQAYRAWLDEAIRGQRLRDQREFEPSGTQAQKTTEAEEIRPGSEAKFLVERDPLILVVCEGGAFPEHIAQSLGRKFGVAFLDYVQGDVLPTLGPLAEGGRTWGRVKLLLVHQRLRVSSGLELTRHLVQEERCPLPILVAGVEEDVALKRNRAVAAGAVDFISVEPFNVLKVMKAIEDTLKMFG